MNDGNDSPACISSLEISDEKHDSNKINSGLTELSFQVYTPHVIPMGMSYNQQ